MDRTVISWNLPNWITVVLMAAAGYLVVGLIAQVVIGQLGSNDASQAQG